MYSIYLGVVLSTMMIGVTLSLYSTTDDVIELTEQNFNTRVIQSNDVWLIEFYAPWCGHCKSLAPEWKKAATALKGFVKVGAVDMTAHQSVGAPYNIQGFPTIKIFAGNKQSPEDYNGARSASAIIDSALSHVRGIVNERLTGKMGGQGSSGKQSSGGDSKDVIELTDSNFEQLVLKSNDMWLVEFFAPWCGHCKNLVPHWQSAATELKGKVKLGAVDATVHTIMASRYNVRGYPTIKLFPAGVKDGEAAEYDGGRTSSDIVAWALEKLTESVPPPELVELTNEDILKEACNSHQLCVVSVLPHILDCQSKCRNDYLSLLRSIGEKHKRRMWGWVWAEAGSQMEVEDSLNIGGFGYPAMAVINARKMKFSLFKGSFSEKGLHEFLLEVGVGRGSIEGLRSGQLPKVVTSQPWDGKDGVMPIEEDYDLTEEPTKKDKEEL